MAKIKLTRTARSPNNRKHPKLFKLIICSNAERNKLRKKEENKQRMKKIIEESGDRKFYIDDELL